MYLTYYKYLDLFQMSDTMYLSLVSFTSWCFSLTMEAWLFKRRMNAEMIPLWRQAISRSDLRCSALLLLLLLLLLLPLCSLLQLAYPPPLKRLWRGRTVDGPEVSLLSRPGLSMVTTSPTIPGNFSASVFCQTCGLSHWDVWDVHRSIWKITRGRGLS